MWLVSLNMHKPSEVEQLVQEQLHFGKKKKDFFWGGGLKILIK